MTEALEDLRKAERQRKQRSSRERRLFVLTLLPLGAALALCALYVTLPVFVAAEDPYYRPQRPDTSTFFQAAAAPLLAGVAVSAASALIVSELAGGWPAWVRFAVAGLLFGASVQFATGLLMPLNRLFLDAAEGIGGGVSDRIISAVYGTPLFATTYGTRGIGIGIVSGLVYGGAGLIAWLPHKVGAKLARIFGPPAVSAVTAVALCLVLFAGPATLFQWLVSVFDGR
ncbi:MAG: hypothetical protein HY678_11305 [Chloroflexi bacterium]|nr:hypothetical protein [Chloroflexota bacterium]